MGLLELRNISRSFGGLAALREVSFSIDTNELVALIGPNGAGKTTLFNVISGIYRPTNGTLLFKEGDITGLPMYEISMRGIARVFQLNTLFFNISALDNVIASSLLRSSNGAVLPLFFRRSTNLDREQEAKRLLEEVGLLGRKSVIASKLPYGEQRRLALASALATKPSLLLLDEPTIGMNPEETRALMDLILSLQREQGLTIMIVEHNMKVVMEIAKRIIVLNFGEIIADGPPKEIIKNGKVIDIYLGSERTEI